MFKKLSTTSLLVIIGLLAGLVLFNKFVKSKKEESTFRSEFVSIDTANVNGIFIYPQAEKGKEIRIIKDGSKWKLENDKIKTFADSNEIKSLLAPFALMKSVSLAGQDTSSWRELQVTDSSGTKIKITTNDNQSYEFVVGKFGYNPDRRGGLTYIRYSGEEAVYAVEGFLSYSVNRGINSFRNKTFLSGNKDNWTSLTLSYPADSGFMLNKNGNEWTVNGIKADSAKAAQYLNQLSNMQSSGFADAYTPSSTPIYTLSISGNNQNSPITVRAYPADSTQKLILHSSLNPDGYFIEGQSHLAERIFVGRQNFLASPEGMVKK